MSNISMVEACQALLIRLKPCELFLNVIGISRRVFDSTPVINGHSFNCFDNTSFASVLKLKKGHSLKARFKCPMNQGRAKVF